MEHERPPQVQHNNELLDEPMERDTPLGGSYLHLAEADESEDEGINPKDLIGITKPNLFLVPPSAEIYMALAFADGASKYGPYNWREKKVKASVYIAALKRHIADYVDGQNNADDSGVPHLGHALACLAILVDATETGNLHDDRPTPGNAPELLAEWTQS